MLPYVRDDDLAPTVARGHVLLAAWEYEEQKERLRQAYERDDVDVFVASFTVQGTETEFVSWCSWGEDVDSLLPRTDVVVIGGQGWAFAVRFPPRVRTVQWPDRATLEKLFELRHPFHPHPKLP